MHIRCPDPSSSSSFASSSFVLLPPPSDPISRPTRPPHGALNNTTPVAPTPRPSRRSSSSLRRRESIPGKLKRTDSAILAAKKEHHRGDARPRSEKIPRRAWSFVYVGNLKPTVTEDQLRARFSPCGPILKIVIRCSSGQVTKKGLPFGPRDMRYATIEFRDSKAYLGALRLNGHLLDDIEMVVCTSPLDLPEAKERNRPPSTPAQTPRIHYSPYNRRPQISPTHRSPIPLAMTLDTLELKPTLKPPDTPPAAEDRFRFLGLSFAKCIM